MSSLLIARVAPAEARGWRTPFGDPAAAGVRMNKRCGRPVGLRRVKKFVPSARRPDRQCGKDAN